MHTTLNLLLMLNFLFVAEVSLLRLELIVFVCTLLAKTIGCATSKPSADVALDFQSDCLTFLVPHS